MSISTYIAASLAVALILSIGYTIWTKLFEQKYTRERFAFASLTAVTALLATAISQISSSEGLPQRLVSFVAHFFGIIIPAAQPASLSEKMLIAVLAIVGVVWIHLVNRSSASWRGQLSIAEFRNREQHRTQPWLVAGIDEGMRVLRRAAPRSTHTQSVQTALQAILDPHARGVNVRDGVDRRMGRNQIGRFDFGIGRRESDRLGALRFRADQPDILDAATRLIGQFAGRREWHIFHGHAQPQRDLPRHIGRHAFGIAVGALSRHQQKIRKVDARAQYARGRQLGNDVRHHEVTPSFQPKLYAAIYEKESVNGRAPALRNCGEDFPVPSGGQCRSIRYAVFILSQTKRHCFATQLRATNPASKDGGWL